jgi:hypothetical protein
LPVLPMLRVLVVLGKNIKKSNIDLFLCTIILIEILLSETGSYRMKVLISINKFLRYMFVVH